MELKRVNSDYRFGYHFYVNELRNVIIIIVSIFTLTSIKELFIEYFEKINNQNDVNENRCKNYIQYLTRSILTFILISLLLLLILSMLYVNSFYNMRLKIFDHFKKNFITHSNTPDILSFEEYYCTNDNLQLDEIYKIKVYYLCFMYEVFDNYYIEKFLIITLLITLSMCINQRNNSLKWLYDLVIYMMIVYFILNYLYYILLHFKINTRLSNDEIKPFEKYIKENDDDYRQNEINHSDYKNKNQQKKSVWFEIFLNFLEIIIEAFAS